MVDEVHCAAADVFTKILSDFKPIKILGVSATIDKDNGMSFLMYNNIGPLLHTTPFQKMVDIGNVMRPFLRPIYLQRSERYKSEIWSELVTELKDDKYTLEVISSVIKMHHTNGDSQLCIMKQKSLINLYYHYLIEVKRIPKEEIGVMVGQTKTKERNRILMQGREGSIKIILASTVFDKAISLNELNVLHNIFPSRERNNSCQRCGRVSRTSPGKIYAIIYDYIYDHGICLNQYQSRKKNNRMEVYNEVSVVPEYNNDLINYIDNTINENRNFKNRVSSEFISKYKKTCVMDITNLKIPTFDIRNYEPIINIGTVDDD